mgnify:CR=1 FL=1
MVDKVGPNDLMQGWTTSFPPSLALLATSQFRIWLRTGLVLCNSEAQTPDRTPSSLHKLHPHINPRYNIAPSNKATEMLPLHLTNLLNTSFVEVVADNARSHVSKDQGTPKRRHSAPSSSPTPRKRRGSLKRTRSDPASPVSRWESERNKNKDYPPSMNMDRSPMEGSSLRSVVLSKPVRRQSIDDPELLAMLHDSLSSFEGVIVESNSTSAILAKVLETLNLYDEDF